MLPNSTYPPVPRPWKHGVCNEVHGKYWDASVFKWADITPKARPKPKTKVKAKAKAEAGEQSARIRQLEAELRAAQQQKAAPPPGFAPVEDRPPVRGARVKFAPLTRGSGSGAPASSTDLPAGTQRYADDEDET